MIATSAETLSGCGGGGGGCGGCNGTCIAGASPFPVAFPFQIQFQFPFPFPFPFVFAWVVRCISFLVTNVLLLCHVFLFLILIFVFFKLQRLAGAGVRRWRLVDCIVDRRSGPRPRTCRRRGRDHRRSATDAGVGALGSRVCGGGRRPCS